MLKILRTNIWCDNGLFEACPIMSGIRSIAKRLQICLLCQQRFNFLALIRKEVFFAVTVIKLESRAHLNFL